MTKPFLFLYDWFSERRWLLWSFIGIIVTACVFLASRLDYQEDISAFLPQDEESARYMSVYNRMGGQDRIVVVFRDEGGFDYQMLEEAMDAFGDNLRLVDVDGIVRDLQIQVDESQMYDVLSEVWQTYPLLMSESDYERAESLLSDTAFVGKCMEENCALLMLPTSGIVSQSLPYDPLHLCGSVMASLRSMQLSDHYQLRDGYVFDKDGRVGLAFLSSPYSMSESKENARLADILQTAIDSTEAIYHGVDVSAVGAPLIAVTNARQIKYDSLLAVIVAVVLIFAMLIYSFRRWNDLVWIALSITFGWLFAIGCLAIFKASISIIVIGIGSVIIGIAVNYPLHYLDHIKHETDKREALREMVPPLLIGNITTVSAFLCLVFLDADAMKDLGLFGSLMLVGTILFVLVALPVLAPARTAGEGGHSVYLHVRLPFFNRHRKWVFAFVVLATLVLGYFSLGTSFDTDMRHINYMTPSQRADMRMLSTSIKANDTTETLFAVSHGQTLDEALENNERLVALLTSNPLVQQISGLSSILPSCAAQEQRAQRWIELWQQHPEAIETLQKQATQLGFSSTAFNPFFHLTSHLSSLTSHLSSLTSHFVMTDSITGTVSIVNFVQVPRGEASAIAEKFRPQLQDDSFLFATEDVSNSLVSLLSKNFNYIGFVCGFVVFAFLWFSFCSFELTLLSFLPLTVGWLWILGLMNLLGMQFNIVNIILATFIFGQGDDYTIFITEGLLQEYRTGKKTLASYKNSVALSGIIMFIGIGALILAKHPALRSLAMVAMVGMGVVVLMACYLPPVIFRWMTEKDGQRREVPLTLKRIVYSLFSILFFIIGTTFFLIPFAWIYFHVGPVTKQKRLRYHRLISWISRFTIHHVPGVRVGVTNDNDEDFSRPSVIVANHQSHLDLMCILMLSPKIVLLTNDWVWNNWFYRKFIKYAEYYPISDGFDRNAERIRDLARRGYSVMIFPEGTRSNDLRVHRFHQGAFKLAQQLEIDVLPVYLHGVGWVLPKYDFMLRQGNIEIEVGKRISYDVFKDMSSLALAQQVRSKFMEKI
ncbi:MAG: 1-acyl-sn-glycerol-3-phosphate acyltransferase [Bacteroidaceae bacterium]|nr:1-acyl-sn-glycerol-3-phosphate acyltransferase [Bacteroidaceae bacterium]